MRKHRGAEAKVSGAKSQKSIQIGLERRMNAAVGRHRTQRFLTHFPSPSQRGSLGLFKSKSSSSMLVRISKLWRDQAVEWGGRHSENACYFL